MEARRREPRTLWRSREVSLHAAGKRLLVLGYALAGPGETERQASFWGNLVPVGKPHTRKRLPLVPPSPSGPGGRRSPASFPASLAFSPQRWRKTWAVLYPASPHGVARLEFFDHKGSSSGGGRGGSRRLDCKVIRLAECVSVAPVAVESPPEPGAAAFRLDTAQRSHLLAADAPSSAAWVQTLCLNAFPVRGPGLPASGWGEPHWAPQALQGEGSYSHRGAGQA